MKEELSICRDIALDIAEMVDPFGVVNDCRIYGLEDSWRFWKQSMRNFLERSSDRLVTKTGEILTPVLIAGIRTLNPWKNDSLADELLDLARDFSWQPHEIGRRGDFSANVGNYEITQRVTMGSESQ